MCGCSRISWGDEAGKAIGATLATNRTLTELGICQNKIGDAGGEAIASGMRTNQTLSKLFLSHNGCGDSTGKKFALALAQNSHLKLLSLGAQAGVGFSAETKKAMASAWGGRSPVVTEGSEEPSLWL